MARPSAAGRSTKIGERLRSRRLQLNLTQRQIADKLGVEPASVSGWERGSASPDQNNLIGLGKVLNVSLEWILTGADGPVDAPPPAKKGDRAKAGSLSTLDLQDFDFLIGEIADRIHAVYTQEGYALSIRDAVAMAINFHKDAPQFTNDAEAGAAIDAELARIRQFLRTLPRRIGDDADCST